MIRNVASGDDEIAVQAGVVLGNTEPREHDPDADIPAETYAEVQVSNERHGNARVGAQHDVVHGDLHL